MPNLVGTLARPLSPGERSLFERLPLSAGRWRIAVQPATDGALVRALCGSTPSEDGPRGSCTLTVPAGGDTTIEVGVMATATDGLRVHELRIDRLSEPGAMSSPQRRQQPSNDPRVSAAPRSWRPRSPRTA